MRKYSLGVLLCLFLFGGTFAQKISSNKYWNQNTLLIPWRLPLCLDISEIEYIDLDKDGDPDLLKFLINDSIPAIWIDDDDDMKNGDLEGDLDNDCLLIDRNQDGIFAGPGDLSIDWIDTNNDKYADIQVVVENSNKQIKKQWDWSSSIMWVMNPDPNHLFNYINWKDLLLECWSHEGSNNFFEGYQGQTLFLKTHLPSYRYSDFRFNWENPFLFYDPDKDGLTEMTIRLEDGGYFADSKIKKEKVDTYPTKQINRAFLSFDLDNDNSPQNSFDFDMTLYFSQGGFSYVDQIHHFDHMRGLPEADYLFFDNRWRKLNELVYTSHDSAWSLIFKRGKWGQCWMVFDEDDDCERWERVELYEPKNPFKIGMNHGGLDTNPQSDAAGDRGEWDSDNSGKGSLYLGFDSKIHLYGAEKGYWRIDQKAASYQGWGGLYQGSYQRTQTEPTIFPTIEYKDTDNDGFFDKIQYDLDGDTIFEKTVDLISLGIKPAYPVFTTENLSQKEVNDLFLKAADETWENAMMAVETAKKAKLNYHWYDFYLTPKNTWEKYSFGYWLQFYLYNDLEDIALKQKKPEIMRNDKQGLLFKKLETFG